MYDVIKKKILVNNDIGHKIVRDFIEIFLAPIKTEK